jgi:hypothetical protein
VGEAQKLIVLVHGCCTDADDVKMDWGWDKESLGALIKSAINHTEWEVVI